MKVSVQFLVFIFILQIDFDESFLSEISRNINLEDPQINDRLKTLLKSPKLLSLRKSSLADDSKEGSVCREKLYSYIRISYSLVKCLILISDKTLHRYLPVSTSISNTANNKSNNTESIMSLESNGGRDNHQQSNGPLVEPIRIYANAESDAIADVDRDQINAAA